MRRQLAVIGAEPAEVDDLADAGGRGGQPERTSGLGVLALEVVVVERVHEVDRDVDAVERVGQRPGVVDVAVHRLARAVVVLGVAGHRPDRVAGLEQRRHQPPADEAGGAGDEDGGHSHTLGIRW